MPRTPPPPTSLKPTSGDAWTPDGGGGGVFIYRLDSQWGVSQNRNSFAAGQIIANCNARAHGLPEVLGHFVSNPPKYAVKKYDLHPLPGREFSQD